MSSRDFYVCGCFFETTFFLDSLENNVILRLMIEATQEKITPLVIPKSFSLPQFVRDIRVGMGDYTKDAVPFVYTCFSFTGAVSALALWTVFPSIPIPVSMPILSIGMDVIPTVVYARMGRRFRLAS